MLHLSPDAEGEEDSLNHREGEEYEGIMKPLQGREQAAIDYNEEVEHIVKEATEGNTYIKAADHWEHIADFLAHLVAASFASPELAAKTLPGYDFLPRGFPTPKRRESWEGCPCEGHCPGNGHTCQTPSIRSRCLALFQRKRSLGKAPSIIGPICTNRWRR